jgi:hypothetical protein
MPTEGPFSAPHGDEETGCVIGPCTPFNSSHYYAAVVDMYGLPVYLQRCERGWPQISLALLAHPLCCVPFTQVFVLLIIADGYLLS